jgi:hypothetical protein
MFITVSAEFERGVQLEPEGKLPEKPQEGMVKYFIDGVLAEPGPHYYNGTDWIKL